MSELQAVRAHSGQIGFVICAKANAEGPPLDPRTPRRPAPEAAISGYPPLRCASSSSFSHDMASGRLLHLLDGPQQDSVNADRVASVSVVGTCGQL